MAKRGRVDCSRTKVSKRIRDKKDGSIDILPIDILPDELLVLILSFLPLKEAVATSVLSCRFRYMWTFISKLDFDGTSSMVERGFGKDAKYWNNKARLRYVRWVNRVMALHKSPKLEEFRVFFDLTSRYKSSIDEWLAFALARKVERLELNFSDELCKRDYYTLGRFSDSMDGVKYLKKIFLNRVNVNDEALAFFLRNCPLLQHLSISKSRDLLTPKIVGPYPSFKGLEISFCDNIKSVEIRDANLVYLKYVGKRIDFVAENLPLLVEIYIGAMDWAVIQLFLSFYNYISQLEILTLEMSGKYSYPRFITGSCVKMSNLKKLTVKATWIDYDKTLILLANLVHGPCLQRFVFEVTHPLTIEKRSRNVWPLFKSWVNSYPLLKEIQFVGYQGFRIELDQGFSNELEWITHLLVNTIL